MSRSMATLVRRALSSHAWTQNQLRAFNIQVVEQSLPENFLKKQLPPVPPGTLRHFSETMDRELAPDDETYQLLSYLDYEQKIEALKVRSTVDNFMLTLLETMGYVSSRYSIVFGLPLPLITCGKNFSAEMDIGIRGEIGYLLLVQKAIGRKNPEPRLIAEAIAAYQENKIIRETELHLPTLNEITFPGITHVGTVPTFYKIKVTAELNDAVVDGTFRATPTVVYRHTPQLPHSNREGMNSLDNRAKILQYYQAFKPFIQS
ncbi:hypothetical protein OG21DRAFT_1270405 [Imleria badia]|nr:hypothetical protein OG21DRAFT_1270405 [Imleria badia]